MRNSYQEYLLKSKEDRDLILSRLALMPAGLSYQKKCEWLREQGLENLTKFLRTRGENVDA